MVDVTELCKSGFWKKKFRRAVITRDADKTGFITRRDFELVLEHYKRIAGNSTKKIEKLSKIMFDSCNQGSLTDASVKLSYKEFEKSGR